MELLLALDPNGSDQVIGTPAYIEHQRNCR